MDVDDRKFSLGWANEGAVEPRVVHVGSDEDLARREAGKERAARAEQDDDDDVLDTWWATIARRHR